MTCFTLRMMKPVYCLIILCSVDTFVAIICRYTARALHRIFNVKYEAKPWPAHSVIENVNLWSRDVGLLPYGCNAGDHEMWELPHACTADTTASPFGQLLSKIFHRINVCPHRLTFGFYDNFTRVLLSGSPQDLSHSL